MKSSTVFLRDENGNIIGTLCINFDISLLIQLGGAGWGMFAQMLAYKTQDQGGRLVKVAPHYTTVDCSYCGHPVKKSLSIRTHVCPKCGFIADRDTNAAINILSKAKGQFCVA